MVPLKQTALHACPMTVNHALTPVATSIENKTETQQISAVEGQVTQVGDLGTHNNREPEGELLFQGDDCRTITLMTDAVSKHLALTRTEQTVKLDDEYFKEPILWASGVLAAGTTGALAFALQCNYASLATIPRWRERLAGWARWRATWHVRITLSPSPYVAGLFRLWHEPPLVGNYTTAAGPQNRALQYPAFMQTVGLDLDVGEVNAGCMSVPHVSPVPWLTNPDVTNIDNGYINLSYQIPLTVGSGSGVLPSYQAWVWLSDVEVDGRRPLDTEVSDVVPQANEADAEDKPVSTFLRAAGRLSTWAGKKVPYIAPYTTPLSWAARLGAKAAAAFGLSKPDRNTTVQQMLNTRQGYGPNATGNNIGMNTGLAHDAAVDQGYALTTTVDEMSHDYVCGIKFPLCINTFAAQATGGYLTKGIITPWASVWNGGFRIISHAKPLVQATGEANKAFWPGPDLLVASMYALWRGTNVYTVKIAKTRFHAGRLEFLYYYKNAASTDLQLVPTTFQGAQSVYRHELDLSAGSEFTIRVPFSYDTEFCTWERGIGIWAIRVISPLVAPATVASSISYVVHHHMEDVSFASPLSGMFQPVNADEGEDVFPQACELHSATVGEAPTSLKQLLLREYPSNRLPANRWAAEQKTSLLSSTVGVTNPLNMFRWCYVYEKGGKHERHYQSGQAKVVLVPHGRPESSSWLLGPVMQGGVPDQNDVPIRIQRFCPLFAIPTTPQGQAEIFPPYQITNPTTVDIQGTALGGWVEIPLDAYTPVFESVADDFRFMVWYSTIPVQFRTFT